MLKAILSIFGGGFIDRVFDTIDTKIQSETDREKLKADVIQSHLNTRPDYMKAGGFVLMLLAGAPFLFHAGSVAVYSVLWHANGPYPQNWNIAALPPPFDQWEGAIIMAIFGIPGAMMLRKK